MYYRRTDKQIDDLAHKILGANLKSYDDGMQIRGAFRTMFASDVIKVTVRVQTIRKYRYAEHKKFSFHKLIDLLEDK